MENIGFESIKEKEVVGDVQKFEKDFPKLQEIEGFTYNSENNTLKKKLSENFAEKLVEGLK